MIIEINFYPDAQDLMDAHASKPKRTYQCHTIEEAMMAIGMIERHEEIPPVEIDF